MDLHQNLVAEMECLVCTEYMNPPIMQCSTGHSFCSSCSKKVDRCPTCRSPFANGTRNFVLERIFGKLKFPCRNRDSGCPETHVGNGIVDHHKACTFCTTRCPLGINNCNWLGLSRNVLTHYREAHSDNIVFSIVDQPKWSNFLVCESDSSLCHVTIFHVHGHFFKCIWDVSLTKGFIPWRIFLMDEPEDGFTFGYVVNVRGPNETKLLRFEKCSVHKFDGDVKIRSGEDFTVRQFDKMKFYCVSNLVSYVFQILKFPKVDG